MSMGMTAFAATLTEEDKQFTVIKNVSTDTENKTYAPNETFKFKIEAGNAANVTYEANGKEETAYAEAGLMEGGNVVGLSISTKEGEEEAEFTSDMEYPSNGVYTKQNVKIDIDESKFKNEGVYHYILSEIIPEAADKYPGIKYDESKYHIYVFVLDVEGQRTYKYIAYKEDGEGNRESSKAAQLSFTNSYGDEGVEDSTHDVTINKVLDGTQASKGEDFKFNITIESDYKGEGGEKFAVEYAVTSESTPVTTEYIDTTEHTEAEPKEITIKGTGYIKIKGLTAGDKIKVNEEDYSNLGYSTTYTEKTGVSDFEVTKLNDKTDDFVTFKVSADGASIDVVNSRNAVSPTGIAMTFAPYALMVAFAGVFAVMFLRKKREDF